MVDSIKLILIETRTVYFFYNSIKGVMSLPNIEMHFLKQNKRWRYDLELPITNTFITDMKVFS